MKKIIVTLSVLMLMTTPLVSLAKEDIGHDQNTLTQTETATKNEKTLLEKIKEKTQEIFQKGKTISLEYWEELQIKSGEYIVILRDEAGNLYQKGKNGLISVLPQEETDQVLEEYARRLEAINNLEKMSPGDSYKAEKIVTELRELSKLGSISMQTLIKKVVDEYEKKWGRDSKNSVEDPVIETTSNPLEK